jgi:hypothetical protein
MKKYYKLREYEAVSWAIDHCDLLSEDLQKTFDKFIADIRSLDDFQFHSDQFLDKTLNKLAVKQFPGIEASYHDEKFNFMDDKCDFVDFVPVMVLKIITDQKAGNKAAKLYTDFELMKSEAAEVAKPEMWTDADRNKLPAMSDAKWQLECRQHNNEALQKFNYNEKLKAEYLVTIKKALLKYMPEIQNFGTDEMIVYDHILNESFKVYLRICSTLAKRFDYGLEDEGFIVLEYEKDLEKKISKLSKARKAEGEAKQKMRWMSAKK